MVQQLLVTLLLAFHGLVSGQQLLLLVGTGDGDLGSDFELLDISTGLHCREQPPNLPISITNAMAALVNGDRPMVCGGFDNDEGVANDRCFEYLPEENSWEPVESMLALRYNAGSAILPDGSWWMTGGEGGSEYSTDLYVDGAGFSYGPGMLEASAFHCVSSLDETFSAVIATGIDDHAHERAYIFDWRTSVSSERQNWIRIKNLLEKRKSAGCGMVLTERGDAAILVAGGISEDEDESDVVLDSAEIFTIENGTITNSEWRFVGDGIPDGGVARASYFTEDNEFYLVGGERSDGSVSDKIYKFSPDSEEWSELNARLSQARAGHISIFLPSSQFSLRC